MQIFEGNSKNNWGYDFLGEFFYVGDYEALEEFPSRNMHFQGLVGIIIQRMLIFEENTTRVGG